MSTNDFLQHDRALPPVRGLILGCSRRGDTTDLTALRQWLRLCVERFTCQKADFWMPRACPQRVLPLLEEASHLRARLSLYTGLSNPPEDLRTLAEAGLLDVHLRIDSVDTNLLNRWADACESAKLPLRVSLYLGALHALPESNEVAAFARASVVIIYLDDWQTTSRPRAVPAPCLDNAVALARALSGKGPEVHVADVPFCQLPPDLWGVVANTPQRLAYHQHLHPDAEAFARTLAGLSATRMQQAIEIELGHGVSFHNPIDRAVLPWVLEKPRGLFWLWFLHKLTRRLFIRRRQPQPLPEDTTYLEHRLTQHRSKTARSLGPACVTCRLHPVCDRMTEAFKQAFPGKLATSQAGEPCYNPLEFRSRSSIYFDEIDETRRAVPSHRMALAGEARRITAGRAPTREVAAESYALEEHATDRMPASVRWFSFSTQALRTTPLARLTPPITLSATFGGGIAERVGFCVGRHAWILCPMTAFRHKVTLHVDRQGHYVLLRDDVLVRPCGFSTMDTVPERLGSMFAPRLAAVNIDGQLVTQTVLVWEGQEPAGDRAIRHSVVIVCSRFSRRLQAVLRALAHKRTEDAGVLEVIVGYVPGIDATDDVLDTIEISYPHLSIHRMPFPIERQRAKGLMINECVALASGEWVTLLDADILLPPDYFSRLDALEESVVFAAPEGRYMLDTAATAAVLLGELEPWKDYTGLQARASEYRHQESEGMPPGFCQSVRRRIFAEIQYAELEHFEGSDWLFSKTIVDRHGKETRMRGVGVLHLDHGGSQWYGTDKQR